MANSQEPQDSSGDSSAGEGIRRPEGKTAIIDTDYVIGQDNISARALGINLDLHGKVFTISSIVVLLFVFLTLAFQAQVEPILSGVRDWLTGNLSWVFLAAVDFFVVVCIGLILSPLGKVRLGGPDAKPDFSYFGWFAMLFAAGMGIGLVFYGVSEPMSHFGTSLAGPAVGPTGFAPILRHSVVPRGMKPGRCRLAWRQRSTTGAFIRGRFTVSLPWRWRYSRSTRVCR